MKSRFEKHLYPPSHTADDLPAGLRDDFRMERSEDREGENPRELSDVIGGSTGERDRDVVPGGWAGTDDATSTAPSDLDPRLDATSDEDGGEYSVPELSAGVGLAGAITDIKGTPMDDTRDWENDPIIADR